MAIPINENRTILKDADGKQLVIPEKSSGPVITMTLLDETGAPVPLAVISTATLTIYARDEAGQPIINTVDDVDIKNVGRGSIHSTSGLLTLTLDSADNSIQNSANDLEWHRLLLEVTYNGSKQLKYEIDVPVRNLYRVN
ncbi:MAG TPA: hypothetical protein PKA61_07610 [Nitrospira sp.]|nr:hypothetical protein [Nitrospira sp.]